MHHEKVEEITLGTQNWFNIQESINGTSLVVQWLRIRLPMQGIGVPSLVWEDPTCRRATKPMCHNY